MSKYQKPPNLRSASTANKRCGTCAYLNEPNGKKCMMYGGYPVHPFDVCDEFVKGKPGTRQEKGK
jgi:hypothetical protein